METQKTTINKFLIAGLLLSLAFNIYQWSDNSSVEESYALRVDSLITATVDVERELNDTYVELNQYKGINTKLDSLLVKANNEIDIQKDRIKTLMRKEEGQEGLTMKLSAEMRELKKLRDNYLEQIDSLLVENEQLKKDKTDLTTTVETLSKNLQTTVNTASVLKSEYFKATAYRKRSNDKYLETAMAKRTNKLEACFTLLENEIAEAGQKTIYLRIIEPGGKILGNRSEGSSTFRKSGTEEDLLYTASANIEYNNQKSDQCIAWEDDQSNFTSGTYLLEVYVDGSLSGSGSVSLR